MGLKEPNEGEFKKRLKEDWENQKKHNVIGFGHVPEISISEVKDWIDEANKDLVFPEAVDTFERRMKDGSIRIYLVFRESQIQGFKRRLIKWLGEKKVSV